MWDPHAFGAAVQQARKVQGLTQEQLGEKVGVTGQAVSKWETGESAPDLTLLPTLCSVLEVSADALLGTAPSQGLNSMVQTLKQRLDALPRDQRTRRVATTIARFLLGYIGDRVETWSGEDFLAVARHDDGGFGHATLMTQHGGVLHVQDAADFPGEDVSDEDIVRGLLAIADPRKIGMLRRIVAHRHEGVAVSALAREDAAVRQACDHLIDAGYLLHDRNLYDCTGVGMLLTSAVLLLAAVPGITGESPRLQHWITTGLPGL